MRNKKILALLLALVLLAGMTGCTRKSRRPALPAAPLQSSFTAEDAASNTSADAGEENAAAASAPMMKSAAENTLQAAQPEQTTEELLEEFVQPLEKEDALYQDYTTEHRAAYKKLRQRPEEVIELVLPELLENPAALECYSDDTSRTTLLYCLFKDTLQNEPFCWDSDSYRWLSDMMAEFIQFVSRNVMAGEEEYFEQYAPLMGFSAAVMQAKPALRLNMTACEPMTNAQALTNAKLVFAAAREIRLGESMQSVFSKMPAYDTTLKKWALQEIYGWADPAGGTATLSFVADSFYVLDITTSGGRHLSITFARIDNTVKWMDLS